MWSVRFALYRPYIFVIVTLSIAIFGSILKIRTALLPDIDIPIASVIWTYSDLDANVMPQRIIGVRKPALPALVSNIQHTESPPYGGVGVINADTEPGPRDRRMRLFAMKLRKRTAPALSACFGRSNEKVIELRARTD